MLPLLLLLLLLSSSLRRHYKHFRRLIRLHIAYRSRPTRWDTCAPQIIVEEAGGVVLPFSGSGEGGMEDVAALLLARDTAGTPPSSSSVGGDLRLSYNKADLSSPPCLFLGRCSTSKADTKEGER